ncbi:MAG: SDR family oxidoreductase [Steroidobacteraceae bacterium]
MNALTPGPTMTEMAAANPQFIQPALPRTPLGRFAQPAEMAAAALFLASSESSFMTGTTLCGRRSSGTELHDADEDK